MKKRLKGYETLTEVRKNARLIENKKLPVPIFKESDNSFSIIRKNDAKAVFIEAIDYAGIRYKLVWSKEFGKKRQIYIPI